MNVSSHAFLLLCNAAIASLLISLCGLILNRCLRRCDARLRHNLLMTALGLTLLVPLMQAVCLPEGIGWWQIQDSSTLPGLSSSDSMTGPTVEPVRWLAEHELARTSLVLIWLMGMIVGIVRTAIALLMMRKFHSISRVCDSSNLQTLVEQSARTCNLKQVPLVALTPFRVGPMVTSWRRPTIVLPQAIESLLSKDELACVLLHECEHIRRRDLWAVYLEQFVQRIFWWNPLLKLLCIRICRVRELACDDQVATVPAVSAEYPSALLKLAQWSTNARSKAGGLCLLSHEAELVQRVRRIRDGDSPIKLGRLRSLVVGGLLMSSVATALPAFYLASDDRVQVAQEMAAEQQLVYVRMTGGTQATSDSVVRVIMDQDPLLVRGLIVDLRNQQVAIDQQALLAQLPSAASTLVPYIVLVDSGEDAILLEDPLTPPATQVLVVPPKSNGADQLRFAINLLSHV